MLKWIAGKPSPGPREGTVYYITAQPNWTLCRLIHNGVDSFCLHQGNACIGTYATSAEAKAVAEKLQEKAK